MNYCTCFSSFSRHYFGKDDSAFRAPTARFCGSIPSAPGISSNFQPKPLNKRASRIRLTRTPALQQIVVVENRRLRAPELAHPLIGNDINIHVRFLVPYFSDRLDMLEQVLQSHLLFVTLMEIDV